MTVALATKNVDACEASLQVEELCFALIRRVIEISARQPLRDRITSGSLTARR